MSEFISFELGSFFANAGILGLLKMLKKDSNSNGMWHFNDDKNVLLVNKDYLLKTDLTELFINTTNSLEEKSGKLPRFLKVLKRIQKDLKERELTKEEIKELNATLNELEANSYKKAFEVLKKENTNLLDLYQLIFLIKNEKSQETILNILEKIIEVLEQNEVFQILFFREIAYRRINKFWDSVSFLNRNNVAKNMKEIHKKTFEEPLKEYLVTNKEGNFCCEECGDLLNSKNCFDYSFLKGTTADTVRKKNDFWNYKVNSWVCPKCRFVYTLIPLGFSKYNQKYLFLNGNTTIESLEKSNMPIYDDILNEEKSTYENILIEYLEKHSRVEHNIEVIIAGESDKRFTVSIIPKETLIVMFECLEELKHLLGQRININDQTIYLYDIVFHNLLKLTDNYNLIGWLMRMYMKEKNINHYYNVKNVSNIQIHLNQKRRGENNLEKEIWVLRNLGKQLHKKILEIKNTKDDDAVNSLAYKLENAARMNDAIGFSSILMRACMSYKVQLPIILLKGLENRNDFQDLAYAYLFGLLAPTKENKDGNESNEGEN